MSVARTCVGLRRAGWDVQLAYSSRGAQPGYVCDELPAELRAAGVPLHDVPEMLWQVHAAQDARACWSFARLLRRLRPALVHTHTSKAGALGRLAAKLCGVPRVVHSARGWSFYGARGRWGRALLASVERALALGTDCIVAVSEDVRDSGLSYAIANRERYRIIRSGVELERFDQLRRVGKVRRELGIGPERRVVGTLARAARAKAPEVFLAVAERVLAAQPDVLFLFSGAGEDWVWLQAEVARRGLTGRVLLLGHRSDVPEVLEAMDVFLLTSLWEGLPTAVVEAAAARVAIVTTDVSGVRDVVQHEVSALIFPVGDAAGLARGVLQLLSDPGGAAALAVRARRNVELEFERRVAVEAHARLYRDLGLVPAVTRPALDARLGPESVGLT